MFKLLRIAEKPWKGALLVALLALGVLAAQSLFFRPHEAGFTHFNDQIGYITSARYWADEGELRSHVVYPAFADNPRLRLYMPGHYVSLAASYLALGDHPLVWRLPGMLGYVATCVFTFLIGRKLHGTRTGLLAALFVLGYPPHVSYAFTAMAEVPFGALLTGSFALFVHLPGRLRWIAMPLCLAVAFLYRETAALLVLPMLASGGWRGAWIARAIALLATIFLLNEAWEWQEKSGKYAPPLTWIVHGEPNYDDADFERKLPPVAASVWIQAVFANVGSNTRRILERWWEYPWRKTEPLMSASLLLGLLATLWVGARRLRADPFPLAVGGFGLAALALVLTLHTRGGFEHVLLRHMLFVLPFLAVVLADAWRSPLERLAQVRPWAPWLLLAVLVLFGQRTLKLRAREFSRTFSADMRQTLEELGHDDKQLFVYPQSFGLGYVLDHYPVRWSFVPSNDYTLTLLDRNHRVGTLILESWYVRGGRIGKQFIERLGLRESRRLQFQGANFIVYQRLGTN